MRDLEASDVYVYHRYINKIIERYEEGYIHPEKIQRLLETIGRWEERFRKMSVAKQKATLPFIAKIQ